MLIIRHLQRGGYVTPNICYVDETKGLVFKSKVKKKVINNIRIASIPESDSFVCQIRSSDGSGKPAYFEYPVTSDVYLNIDSDNKPMPYCSIGEVAPENYKYVSRGTKILSCSPEEDDTYIYKVIVE